MSTIQTRHYPFEFTVITAVYNSAPFLQETLQSLVNQTIGFACIQVILVDDGSTDGSVQMCDQFAKDHPENVIVVHNPHAGVSHARNTGLSLAQGRYINFLDSDDLFTLGAFESARRFFAAHEGETNVVSFPLYMFDGASGEHSLNAHKFTQGNRVINLEQEPHVIQMHISSSFVKAEAFAGKQFDEKLAYAGDAQILSYILLDYPRVGVVTEEKYMYRIRTSGQSSIIQSSGKKPAWYLDCIEHFHLQLTRDCIRRYGEVPGFIQSLLAHDLQWRIRQKRIPIEILSPHDAQRYKTILLSLYEHIADERIWALTHMTLDRKCLVLRHKHKMSISCPFSSRPDEEQKRILSWQKKSSLRLDFLKIENNALIIEGSLPLLPFGYEQPSLYAVIDGQRISCPLFSAEQPIDMMGETTLLPQEFCVRIPIPSKRGSRQIRFEYEVGGHLLKAETMRSGKFLPLSDRYAHSYWRQGGYVVEWMQDGLSVRPSRFATGLKKEIRFLKELYTQNLLGGRKAIAARLLYHILKPLKRRQLWLFSDRFSRAGDNGEALYRYTLAKKNVRAVYLLHAGSPDHDRVAALGPVAVPLSFKHKIFHLLCDYNISSSADDLSINPFSGHAEPYRDILSRKRFVFLQHGVTQNDVSRWLNRYNKNIHAFITASHSEHESIISGAYFYDPAQIWLTGFPRFDSLYDQKENCIALMPTWREWLMQGTEKETGKWLLAPGFEYSAYFRFFQALLDDPRLQQGLRSHGFKLLFFPHPNMLPYIDHFRRNDTVEFLTADTSYRDVYARSRLIITDYSSAVFDFAYLRKPVLYAQFDQDRFFAGAHVCKAGYFICERDGFGEVEKNVDDLVIKILEYLDCGCQLKDVYRARIDAFFAFDDSKNCERVYDRLIGQPGCGGNR